MVPIQEKCQILTWAYKAHRPGPCSFSDFVSSTLSSLVMLQPQACFYFYSLSNEPLYTLILLPGTISLPSLRFCRKAHSSYEHRTWKPLTGIEILTPTYQASVLFYFSGPQLSHPANGLAFRIKETMHGKSVGRVTISWPPASLTRTLWASGAGRSFSHLCF